MAIDTPTLHLVRHAPPTQDPVRPAREWDLAVEAAAAVAELRASGVLPTEASWVSSPEPKARATAALLTDAVVRVDDDLREAFRSAAYVDADVFERCALHSFADPNASAAPGWEPLVRTRARMLRAARAAVVSGGGGDVVLVGHGTSLTMLVAALPASRPDVPAWRAMRMPDHCAIRWPDELVAPWGSWRRVT